MKSNQNIQLKNVIENKLNKINLIKNLTIKNDILNTHKDNKFRLLKKEQIGNGGQYDIHKSKRDIKIKTELSMREMLQLTGERNRILKQTLTSKKSDYKTFAKELEKEKKEKKIKLFKNFLTKDEIPELHLNYKNDYKKLLKKPSSNRNKENKNNRKLNLLPSKCNSARSFKIKSPKILKTCPTNTLLINTPIIKFQDSKPKTTNDFQFPTHFNLFISSNQHLINHFKDESTQKLLKKYKPQKKFQNKVYNRLEIESLIHDLTCFFKNEKSLHKKFNLASTIGIDLSYKLKIVFKEFGSLLSLIFSEMIYNFNFFKELVGKTNYEIIKNHQLEIIKMKSQSNKIENIGNKKLKFLEDEHQKEKLKNKFQDEERELMKKLIFELQQKDEQNLEIISQLKKKVSQATEGDFSTHIKNKFKSIVKKLIPTSPQQKKMSFCQVSKKIMNMKNSTEVNNRSSFQNKKNIIKINSSVQYS